MKLMHLSDLHLGKRVNDYSMLEDQEYILDQILQILDEELPDGVLIAGDVYDKAVPSAEAVALFDTFLVQLARRKQEVFVISGNHDSPERIAFGSRLMDASGIHMSPVYNGSAVPLSLHDAHGEVRLYMLPFLKPAHVRRFYPEEKIDTYSEALACAVAHLGLDTACRNVLITHQFVTGASRSDSEELSVGGTDNVDAAVFEDFDYVALGHIHFPQNCGSEKIRYCGTPLKYSFSEVRDHKSVTMVELEEKGSLHIRTVPLVPRRELVELKGSFAQLTDPEFYAGTTWQEDYTRITLTDEDDIPEANGKLRAVYHNLMKMDYDNTRTRQNAVITGAEETENTSPLQLFADFFALQNNRPMSPEQWAFMEELFDRGEERT